MSFGRFIDAVRFTDRIPGAAPDDGRHRQINGDLCRAIDMTRLSIVLQQMVDAGILKEAQADIYHGQAAPLIALLRTENNRGHGL